MNKTNIPQAIDIEEQILGTLIKFNQAIDEIIGFIKPQHFYLETNRIIYSLILKMNASGIPFDYITLSEQLKKIGLLEKCGGNDYLNKISNISYTTANIIYHSKMIYEKYIARELYKKVKDLQSKIESDSFDAADLQAEALKEIEGICDYSEMDDSDNSLWDDFQKTIEAIEQRYMQSKESGLVSRTFPSFNRMTGGIRESDVVCIVGDFKQGKTTFAEQLALDFGIYEKIPVGIFSYEMDKESLYNKAFSLRTGIDYNKLRSPKENNLTPDEFSKFLNKAVPVFKDSKIFVCDKVLDKYRLKSKMSYWKRKLGIKIFVVDYLGLIPSNEKKERRDLEISDLSRFFKLTAKELNTPIIILSQANKDGKTAESKGPSRDADFVISVKKPFENGIRSTKVQGENFNYTEDHFLITLDYSRHGRNGFQFICQFINNSFVELSFNHSSRPEPYQNYYEKEEAII